VVAPGFIDVHTHIEGGVGERPTADNRVSDGVTTVVTGNCGSSAADLRAFFADLRKGGVSVNVASLIGHNTVRAAVMGRVDRAPTAEEQARMEALVADGMRAGAVGLSTGLIYIPGSYAATPELTGLARIAGQHGGLYASHIRSEGDKVLEAIDEAISIGRDAQVPVQISHFKISNKRLWGQSTATLGKVDGARAAGLDVTIDQYGYTASSTRLSVLLPNWALAGTHEEALARLRDPATRKKIAAEMKDVTMRRNGRKRLDHAVVARCQWDDTLQGKSIATIAREKGKPAGLDGDIETVLELFEAGSVQMIFHSMDERDVERILRHPLSMVASDGEVIAPGEGVPHPRNYGTNARVLGRYVRERQILPLEEAVRKMTSLPAQRFGLVDRGLVRPGMWADLVIFDDKVVADRATFDKPHAVSAGIEQVLVNGEVVWEHGRHRGTRPGRTLLGPAASSPAPAVAAQPR
jgi:N-acyl-D-amino-acid deacylase